MEADYEVWKTYAYEHEVHPAVISYLNTRTENFCRIETTVDGKFFATPRGWEDLSSFIKIYERLGKKPDREVVGEYIQFSKIAKDFTNYLELYYKYRDDYQIDEILSGTIRESLCNKLGRARFDEKLNVIGLLLSKLNQQFKAVADQGDKTDLLMEELKKIDPGSNTEKEGSMAARLLNLKNSFHESLKQKREAGLLSRREDFIYRDVEELFHKMEEALRASGKNELESDWNVIRNLFIEETSRYDESLAEGGKKLEFAFDFLEAAFATGQEMVIFVTELNTGLYSVKFLKEYDCERYYQYNQNLLFRNREEEMKARINSLGK